MGRWKFWAYPADACSQHYWRGSPLCALTNESDWIAIEELAPTSVIEQHGHDVADLGARAPRDGKASKPGFDLNGPDVD